MLAGHPALLEIAACAAQGGGRDALGETAVRAVARALPHATWSGIYWLDGDALLLGPFVGAPTEHVRIPVGVGVCGTAVAEGRDQVVADVRTRANYLACSTATRSEIVVLIRSGARVVGQLDLDSDRVGAFGPDDHALLSLVAGALGALLAGPLAAQAADAADLADQARSPADDGAGSRSA